MTGRICSAAARYAVLSILLCLQGQAGANTAQVRIPRVSQAPNLETVLESVAGAELSDFQQREPGDGVPSSLGTHAWISYDEDNLYVIFVCEDQPDKVRAHLTRREDITADDRVLVFLDPFKDGRRAYVFACNPLGIQMDGILTEGQEDDYAFDVLWHSEGRLTADGYRVRMTIPFRSVRFSNAPTQVWGIALGRIIPRNNNEESYWPLITKRVEGFVPQFATADGLEGISAGRNMQFIPYGISSGARFLEAESAFPGFRKEVELRGGLDSKLVFQSAYTVDVALNPDFSQVESDEPQVTLNQRYEVVYPERRPFFTENAGYFQTPVQLFFSRRIADPQYGARVTAKTAGWALGALVSDDRAPGRLVETTDPLRGERAENAVMSLRREIGKQVNLGLLGTSRDFARGWNRALGLDARVKLGSTWVVATQAVATSTRHLDGQRLDGPGLYADVLRDGRSFDYELRYMDLDPDFRSDLGYVKRVDMRQVKQQVDYRWRRKKSMLVKYGPTVVTQMTRDHLNNELQDWKVESKFKFEFTGATVLEAQRTEEYELFKAIGFRKHATQLQLDTAWLKWLALSATYSQGTEVNYHPAKKVAPFLANLGEADLTVTLKPSQRLSLDQTYIYSYLRARPGIVAPDGSTSRRIFENPILRWKLNVQVTRPLSLRTIVDYEGVFPNSSLVREEREEHLTGDVLATYLLNPGTALYVGYTDRHENLALDGASSLQPTLRRTESLDQSTSRQFFFKFSYLIQR